MFLWTWMMLTRMFRFVRRHILKMNWRFLTMSWFFSLFKLCTGYVFWCEFFQCRPIFVGYPEGYIYESKFTLNNEYVCRVFLCDEWKWIWCVFIHEHECQLVCFDLCGDIFENESMICNRVVLFFSFRIMYRKCFIMQVLSTRIFALGNSLFFIIIIILKICLSVHLVHIQVKILLIMRAMTVLLQLVSVNAMSLSNSKSSTLIIVWRFRAT